MFVLMARFMLILGLVLSTVRCSPAVTIIVFCLVGMFYEMAIRVFMWRFRQGRDVDGNPCCSHRGQEKDGE